MRNDSQYYDPKLSRTIKKCDKCGEIIEGGRISYHDTDINYSPPTTNKIREIQNYLLTLIIIPLWKR
jgi:hypothetical protein